jgi:hypothetical protein
LSVTLLHLKVRGKQVKKRTSNLGLSPTATCAYGEADRHTISGHVAELQLNWQKRKRELHDSYADFGGSLAARRSRFAEGRGLAFCNIVPRTSFGINATDNEAIGEGIGHGEEIRGFVPAYDLYAPPL